MEIQFGVYEQPAPLTAKQHCSPLTHRPHTPVLFLMFAFTHIINYPHILLCVKINQLTVYIKQSSIDGSLIKEVPDSDATGGVRNKTWRLEFLPERRCL